MTGWPILKIKLGSDRDREMIEAIRETDDSRRLQVDANAAWTADEAIRNIQYLADLGVEMVEQPLPPGDPAAWYALGLAYNDLGDRRHARAAMREAVRVWRSGDAEHP